MIIVDIDVTKVEKRLLSKGKYLKLKLQKLKTPDPEGRRDGFLKQYVPKDVVSEGIEAPIVGNWKDYPDFANRCQDNLAARKAQAAERDDRPKPSVNMGQDDDIPF